MSGLTALFSQAISTRAPGTGLPSRTTCPVKLMPAHSPKGRLRGTISKGRPAGLSQPSADPGGLGLQHKMMRSGFGQGHDSPVARLIVDHDFFHKGKVLHPLRFFPAKMQRRERLRRLHGKRLTRKGLKRAHGERERRVISREIRVQKGPEHIQSEVERALRGFIHNRFFRQNQGEIRGNGTR